MKGRIYLSAVVVAVLCLTGGMTYGQKRTGNSAEQKSGGSARQTWEYKVIFRYRGFEGARQGENFQRAGDWYAWSDNAKDLPTPVDMVEKLTELGDQGWELVSVTARSGYLGGLEIHAAGDFAGFTSDEIWVFKRPKS